MKELGLEAMDRWALVAMVMNFWDPENMGNFYTKELLASQELCSRIKIWINCNEIVA